MNKEMLVTELSERLRKAESDIEYILEKLLFEGIAINQVVVVRHGKKLESNPPGYGCFVNKVNIVVDI